jgi:polyhydroxyalkanoate synthesis regulator phasin
VQAASGAGAQPPSGTSPAAATPGEAAAAEAPTEVTPADAEALEADLQREQEEVADHRGEIRALRRWLVVTGVWAIAAVGVGVYALIEARDAKNAQSAVQSATKADIDRAQNQLSKRIDALEAKTNDLATKSQLQQLQGRVGKVQKDATNAADDASSASDDTTSLTSKVESLERQVNSLAAQDDSQASAPSEEGTSLDSLVGN